MRRMSRGRCRTGWIRGFRLMPELSTPQRIDGVCKLVLAIKPLRDDVPTAEDADPPPFSDSAAAAIFVLREASAAMDQWADHGQGFRDHLLTIGHAFKYPYSYYHLLRSVNGDAFRQELDDKVWRVF